MMPMLAGNYCELCHNLAKIILTKRISVNSMTAEQTPRDGDSIRDAACLVLARKSPQLAVLMGRRPLSFRFMPGVYVFPGGAVDAEDSDYAVARDMKAELTRLIHRSEPEHQPHSLAIAAIREMFEETGIRYDLIGRDKQVGDENGGFGAAPMDLSRLQYLGRALTPPWHVKRFHARFFLDCVETELTHAMQSDELEDIRWIPVAEAKQLKIAPVTTFMLDFLEEKLAMPEKFAARAPFFHWKGDQRQIAWDDL